MRSEDDALIVIRAADVDVMGHHATADDDVVSVNRPVELVDVIAYSTVPTSAAAKYAARALTATPLGSGSSQIVIGTGMN